MKTLLLLALLVLVPALSLCGWLDDDLDDVQLDDGMTMQSSKVLLLLDVLCYHRV